MQIKEYLEKIIEKGDRKDMEELSEILDKAICKVKDCDPEWYNKKCMKLYTMAYGKVLNEEMAKDIIMKMEPYHMHWTLEQTRQVKAQYGLNNIRDIDFWVVLNDKYNNNKETVESFIPTNNEKQLEMYVHLAKDFIMDKDGRDDKVFLYYTTIPK